MRGNSYEAVKARGVEQWLQTEIARLETERDGIRREMERLDDQASFLEGLIRGIEAAARDGGAVAGEQG